MCCQNRVLEELSVSCVNPVREDSRKLVPHFLQVLPRVPFPCADFALYPFAVINHSSDYRLSSEPCESSWQIKPGADLEDLKLLGSLRDT